MSEKKRKAVVFGILIVTVIWGYYNLVGKQPRRVSPDIVSSPSVTAPETPAQDPLQVIPTPTGDAETKSIPWGKDPFYHDRRQSAGAAATPAPTTEERAALHLLGIMYRAQGAKALIDGRIVVVGDTVSGYVITEIAPDFVQVTKDSRTLILRVRRESS